MKLKITAKTLIMLGLVCLTLPATANSQGERSAARDLKVLADTQLRTGRATAAIENYKEALSFDPALKAAYFNLAIAYYTNGKIKEAAESLETLVRLSPGDAEAVYNLGCLKLYLGNTEEAEKRFQEALSCCGSAPRFKPLAENGLSFLDQVKQLDPQTRQALFVLFRQSVVPALKF